MNERLKVLVEGLIGIFEEEGIYLQLISNGVVCLSLKDELENVSVVGVRGVNWLNQIVQNSPGIVSDEFKGEEMRRWASFLEPQSDDLMNVSRYPVCSININASKTLGLMRLLDAEPQPRR